MGATVALSTYYGIEAPRTTFWVSTDEKRVCGRNFNHGINATGRFCPECGTEVKSVSIEDPSPRFAEICQKSGIDPVSFFKILEADDENEGWVWEDDGESGSGRSFKLRWWDVEAVAGLAAKTMALGFLLDSVNAGRRASQDPRTSGVTYREMEIYDRAMREVAKIFGIEGEPKLFSQVYYR